MAIANYQTPTKLTFFPSYLQYAYAAGLIRSVAGRTASGEETSLTDEDLYSLIQLDPSNIKNIEFTEGVCQLVYDIREYPTHEEPLTFNPRFNLDFGMILGHDLGVGDVSGQNNLLPAGYWFTGQEEFVDLGTGEILDSTSIVNWTGNDTDIQFNGWSAFNLIEVPDPPFNGRGFRKSTGQTDGEMNIGSLILGKKWTAPQNIDISNNVSFNYGYKQKKTLGGKVISQMNWERPSKWLLDAWELSETMVDTRTLPTESRNGTRTWNVSWSFLQDKYAMPQNSMQNNINWTQDGDSEYSTGADGSSLYNSTDGIDFMTSVIKPTMGGHLPCVVRISESNNSDQWAIVRISKFSISQKNPKFVDVKLTLEEQV